MVANKVEPGGELVHLDPEMAELSLLLPMWQAKALQDASRRQGISAGQFLRRLLDETLPRTAMLGGCRWVDFG